MLCCEVSCQSDSTETPDSPEGKEAGGTVGTSVAVRFILGTVPKEKPAESLNTDFEMLIRGLGSVTVLI